MKQFEVGKYYKSSFPKGMVFKVKIVNHQRGEIGGELYCWDSSWRKWGTFGEYLFSCANETIECCYCTVVTPQGASAIYMFEAVGEIDVDAYIEQCRAEDKDKKEKLKKQQDKEREEFFKELDAIGITSKQFAEVINRFVLTGKEDLDVPNFLLEEMGL